MASRLRLSTRSTIFAVLALGLVAQCDQAASQAINPAPVSEGGAGPARATQVTTVAEAVVARLADEDTLPLPIRRRAGELRRYYADPASRLLWQDETLAGPFLERLENAQRDGLTPDVYPISSLNKKRRPNRLALTFAAQLEHSAYFELYWSAFFLQYANDIKVGRFLPTKIDKNLYWHKKTIDMVAALQLLAELRSVETFFAAWQPQVPGYGSLRRALAEYLDLQAAGGWGRIPLPDVPLKPGESSPIVAPLRNRLAVTDGAPAQAEPGAEGVYSNDLVAAVKRFQARHGLDQDGIIGKKTGFQLNIPIDDRIRQIFLSMERWRWMPEELGDHYVMVNIAAFQLKRVRGGVTEEQMRVVVGKPYHQTPVFSEAMEYVEINPYWNVPRSIAVNEQLEKLQTNPGLVAAKGFEALRGDKPLPVTSIDWSTYSKSNFPFRLRQKPGPKNALGRAKFMFPNRFNVYMHDTPAHGLFGETTRAFSHGCIRLARPIDFAEQVLVSASGWDRPRIDAVLDSGKRTVVSLKTPINVHLTYSTAWRDRDGAVQFRPDIYRRDAKLYAALFGRPYPY